MFVVKLKEKVSKFGLKACYGEKKISLSGSEMEIFIHVCVVASCGLLLDVFLEDLLFLLWEIIMLIIIIMKHL